MSESAAEARVPSWTQADRLRKAREHAGLTQEQMAAEIGIARRSVSAYESGATVKRPVLLSWAMRTSVPLAWIETGSLSGQTPPDGVTNGG